MSGRVVWLRIVAIAIAIAGAIDPSISAMRTVRPEVAVVAAPRLPDAGLVDRTARSLEARFRVIRGPSLGAAASVAVGDALPAIAARSAPVAFAVAPEPRTPFVTIVAADIPRRAHVHARLPVAARVRVQAGRGKTLSVTLKHAGAVIDHIQRDIAEDDVTVPVELAFVASGAGTATPVLTAEVSDGNRHEVDALVDVRSDRWAVLAFDRRPSWISTFVRRAIESDPRFSVTSRVVTSRGTAAVSGRAPDSLGTLPALEAFDVVVVGAPDALTSQDVDGLDRFLRESAGSVLVLVDDPVVSPVLQRLTGVTHWSAKALAKPEGVPLTSETFLPTLWPSWAEGSPTPVWSMSAGRGRVTVSGTLDAWRYRGTNVSAFDAYWRTTIAEAADRSRDTPASAAPAAGRGPVADERRLLESWVSSHQGRVIAERELAQLAPALAEVLQPPNEAVILRPMRSLWWLPVFAACLGAEWWLRRRTGRR